MPFVKVPDDLPAPQAYLRAGLPRPAAGSVGDQWIENHVVTTPTPASPDTTTADGRTVTSTDPSGAPASVLFTSSTRFLTAPVTRDFLGAEVDEVNRHPTGALALAWGPDTTMRAPTVGLPFNPATARVVTVDMSVVLAGLKPALFEAHDVLFVSAAVALDLAACAAVHPATGRRSVVFLSWKLTTPVPVDHLVLRIYTELCAGDRSPLSSSDPPVDRTDLLCAATAILYDAPLFTTKPEAYAGLARGLGLKVVKYGPTRNRTSPREETAAARFIRDAERFQQELLERLSQAGSPGESHDDGPDPAVG